MASQVSTTVFRNRRRQRCSAGMVSALPMASAIVRFRGRSGQNYIANRRNNRSLQRAAPEHRRRPMCESDCRNGARSPARPSGTARESASAARARRGHWAISENAARGSGHARWANHGRAGSRASYANLSDSAEVAHTGFRLQTGDGQVRHLVATSRQSPRTSVVIAIARR